MAFSDCASCGFSLSKLFIGVLFYIGFFFVRSPLPWVLVGFSILLSSFVLSLSPFLFPVSHRFSLIAVRVVERDTRVFLPRMGEGGWVTVAGKSFRRLSFRWRILVSALYLGCMEMF